MSAANARGAAHVDVTDRLKGRTLAYSDDDGNGVGIQRITVTGGMRATVRVAGAATYFTANRAALVGYFGFPATAANRAAGRWMSVHAGDPGYSQLTEGVTFASAMQEVGLRGPLDLLPARTMGGQQVVGIRGFVSGATGASDSNAQGTLWVAAVGDPLPVAYEAASPAIGTMTVTFSHWGEHVTVPPPAGAAAMTDVLAGRA